jgi:predicted transposase/invertase (TIGR01784 family)
MSKRFNSLPKIITEFLPLFGLNLMTHNITSKANPVIQKATDILMAMSRDEEERLRYEAREEFLLDQQYGLHAARGEGIEIGVRKTALNLINLGMDDEFISKATNLPLKEIQKLRNPE